MAPLYVFVKLLPCFTFVFASLPIGSAETFFPKTTSELQAALRQVLPGDEIKLQDDTEYYGFFRAERSGTQEQPILIEGSITSVISSWSSAFNLEASHYILKGFRIANSKKGILIDGGTFNILENIIVHAIQEEGVHFRFGSSDNVLKDSWIYDTGLTRPGFGEGVYIGQDWSKWTSPNEPDKCDRNAVLNNRIGPCAGENIDIKEGTCCGIIEGNVFDGSALSNGNFDDSWIDVKGNDYVIRGNEGFGTLKDGIQVRTHMPPGEESGCRNEFRRNKFDLTGNQGGVGIFLNSQTQCGNSSKIYGDNVMLTGEQLTNGWVLPVSG